MIFFFDFRLLHRLLSLEKIILNITPPMHVIQRTGQRVILPEKEKMINYIENRLKPNFPWLQLSDGKIFCKVMNMK